MGAGTKDTDAVANVCRLVVGEPLTESEAVVQIDTNVDDLDPRAWPEAIAAVLAAGALDAWVTPIVMKKGRPAHTFSALCSRPSPRGRLGGGVRAHQHDRHPSPHLDREVLERSESTVDVDGRQIRVKTARRRGAVLNRSLEWDDVVAAATALDRSPHDVLAAATARLDS